MTEENEPAECIECGKELGEDGAVYGSGGLNDSGAEKLMEGETVGADELFGFDDGPYCSLGCSIK